VSVDPGQLEQVLINLCVNSRDAMPDGGELSIRTERQTLARARALETAVMQAGEYVAITVTDSGHGMTPETRTQCLEPFFTTKAPGFGTGLGLSTVFGIIKQSGGYIHIESEVGAGTAITVYLPSATPAVAGSTTAPDSVAAPLRASETVLLVDDDTVIRTLLQRVLKQSGYNVLTAADGVEGKALFEAHRDEIHVMVTDMVMPKMGGVDLIKAVTAARPDLKILLMSGYSTEWREGRVPGRYSYMQKPFTARELERKLREVLDAPGAAQH
jgi:CheY-like chemotaxis protein